jgi:acyl-coenzyme A thioesterase PaaI-like protein
MTIDVGAFLLESVPFARTLGITFDSVADGVAVCRVPDRPEFRNHVGGPHAGVLFTLAESASGAAMLSVFGDQLSRATPLPTVSTIRYLKVATGVIVATARVVADRAAVLDLLDSGKRPEFEVVVELRNADSVVVCEVTVDWTLRPNR